MSEASRYRTLVETPEYQAQQDDLAARYSEELLESALLGLLWSIAINPEKHERVTANIRQASSRSLYAAQPQFRIFFSVKNDNEVLLLWIEEVSPFEP